MTTYSRVTLTVTAAERDALVAMIEEAAPEVPVEGATGLFGVPASADGLDPATHYYCSGWVDDALLALLPAGVIVPETDPVFEEPAP